MPTAGLLSLGLSILTLSLSASEPADTVTARVVVQATDGTTVHHAYIALIPPDRSWGQPLAERVAEDGIALFSVHAGKYRIVAVAKGFGSEGLGPVTFSKSTKNEFTPRLKPLKPISGTISDTNGNPIRGARVSIGYAAGPSGVGNFSDLQRRTMIEPCSAASDENGAWTLPVPTDAATPLMFEKAGYGNAGYLYHPGDGTPIDVALTKAATLHLALDRVDSSLIVSLRRTDTATAKMEVPADWQAKVFGRRATTNLLEWGTLAPGQYEVIAKYPNPLSFAQSYRKLAAVSIAAGDTKELSVTLPAPNQPSERVARLFVANVAEEKFQNVEGFGISAAGVPVRMPVASDEVTGGTVLYISAEGVNAPFYAVTSDYFISPEDASLDSLTADGPPRKAAVHSAGSANLHLRSAEADLALPSGGTAVFNDCPHAPHVSSGIEIRKDGLARLPAPAGCRTAVLSFDPFEPVTLGAPIQSGQTRSLGDVILHAAGSADFHAIHDPGGSPASGAAVSVFLSPLKGNQLTIAQTTAGPDGWAHIGALPTRRELHVVVRTEQGDTSAVGRFRVEPRGRTTVDPLTIAAPATLIIEPRIDPDVQRQFPDASIVSVHVKPADPSQSDERVTDAGSSPSITVERLAPGKWQLMAVVKLAGAVSPLYGESVDLTAGETRRVKMDVKPLVFSGRVVSHGEGIPVKLFIGGVQGTPSIIRNLQTSASGAFQVMLPEAGRYDVNLARMPKQDLYIPIGEVDFSDPASPVVIAVPEGDLTVHVHSEQNAVNDAVVMVTSHRDENSQVETLISGRHTDTGGNAHFYALPLGAWNVSASAEGSGHTAEKMVSVEKDDRAVLDIDLGAPAVTLTGTVRGASGNPIPLAAVACVVMTESGIPELATAQTDSSGKFAIDRPAPPPPLARCNAMSPEGEVQPFRIMSGTPTDVTFTTNPGRVNVAWQSSAGPLWLLDGDGGAIDLTPWMARSVPARAFVIPALAPGAWKFVRLRTLGDWIAIGQGGSPAAVAELTLKPGEEKTVNVDQGPSQ
jgi:hypothetical protein